MSGTCVRIEVPSGRIVGRLLTAAAVAVIAIVSVGAAPGQAAEDPSLLQHACPPPVPAVGFVDVGALDVHGAAIDCLVAWEITRGVDAQSYAPGANVTRAQMASFLARLLSAVDEPLAAPDGERFTDVSGVHAGNIEALADAGIVAGMTSDTYGPGQHVTRAQMATFLARTLGSLDIDLPDADLAFDDVPDGVHAPSISSLAAIGVVQGRTATFYAPAGLVTRAQMASFLMRTVDVIAAGRGDSPPYLEPTTPGPDPDPVPVPDPDPDPDPAPTADPDPHPVGGTCSTPILLREEAGSIATPGAVDSVTLQLEEGQRVSFEGISFSTNMAWRLVGPAPLGTVFDRVGSHGDRLATAERSGIYTLELYGLATSTGTYSFRIHDVTDVQATS